MSNELYDVVAVNIATSKVRLISEKQTLANATATVSMAVMRRGVDKEFFAEIPHGKYAEGDKWNG